MPTVASSLGTDLIGISWALLAYQISSIGLSIIFGRVSDLWGREKVFGLGFLVFSLSSLLCGLSLNIMQLILSRFVQGVGGAMLQSSSRALAAESVPEELAGRAQGYMTTAHHVGFVLGPSIGGFMIDYSSWRWSFFLLVPIGLCGAGLTLASLRRGPPVSQQRNVSIDYLGAALLVATTTTLVLIFDRRTHEIIGSNMKVTLALLFVGCLSALIIHESKTSSPFVNLSLFRIRRFSFSVMSLLIIAMCYALTGFLMPFLSARHSSFFGDHSGIAFHGAVDSYSRLGSSQRLRVRPLGSTRSCNGGRSDHGRLSQRGWFAANRFALVFAGATDRPRCHNERRLQSGQFHGHDRNDAPGASGLRLFDEQRDLWTRECGGHRPRRLSDGDRI